MTLSEADDIAIQLRRAAAQMQKSQLLLDAAEAIEWLLKELYEADAENEWRDMQP